MYENLDYERDIFEQDILGGGDIEMNFEHLMDNEDESIMNSWDPSQSMDYLNNRDYSLNSALIMDEMTEFADFIRYDKPNRRWTHKIWEDRRTALEKFLNLETLIHPTLMHQWFGNKNRENAVDCNDIRDLLRETESDSKETFPIIQSFFSAWLDKNLHYIPKTSDISKETLKWGAYFLDLHVLTLFLNAANEEELICLATQFKAKIIRQKEDSPGIGVMIQTKNFGRCMLSNSFTYMENCNILCDRNFLLMMKDTYAARFQTCMSFYGRYDQKYEHMIDHKMNKFYDFGDQLLSKYGNNAYKYFKLVEPACNLTLTRQANRFRPRIPEFPSFRNHVESSIRELCESDSFDRRLFDMILAETNTETALTMYGSFRHWGHPFIDYLNGLKKLFNQTTCLRNIDGAYVEALASDLALIVLEDQFKKKKKWFVDHTLMKDDDPLKEFVRENIWPVPSILRNYGDKFHLLPLMGCMEIPDMFDPSLLYSDKSHSLSYSTVWNHIKQNPGRPIPTGKVLNSLLKKPATNWSEFLKKVNDEGLGREELIIGLREKEREIKIDGRFFSLMSWELRDYFVMTEYLIKKHFVPLFKGLTMADDLNTVVKKMMDNASGQGLDDYKIITIANHLDYEKWNNYQRKASTAPIFKVMGQFLGYPNLIARTHEFFEKSFFYHPGRADLMRLDGDQIVNSTEHKVCWQGQAGGLEGLRQKGWCVINLLVIRREGKNRTTEIKCLAQGDNQVICNLYKMENTRNDEEITRNIYNIVENNNSILRRLEMGTNKLGLTINQDETMQSADYLNYGKIPFFRGNLRGLETKRWSRVTCVTNDQLPSLGNIMATVSTNALTVAHSSSSPLNTICHYNFVGNFVRNLVGKHNPAMRSPVVDKVRNKALLTSREFKIASLFLDPCLGGVSGMSLTRFMIRQFPDPVTESLTFLKLTWAGTTDSSLKSVLSSFGSPRLKDYAIEDLNKLIEDPMSLNLRRGLDSLTLIKEKIKESLQSESHHFRNEQIKTAISYLKDEEPRLITFLASIQPRFPRFLSQYKSSTFLGITESLVSLFQNSRTIRNVFSQGLGKQLDAIVTQSELISYSSLLRYSNTSTKAPMWECSSTHADELRLKSWSSKIMGATIPHPAEMFGFVTNFGAECDYCLDQDPIKRNYISLLLNDGLKDYWEKKGKYSAYLGTSTSETTSILTPWEKNTDLPFLRRAADLRTAIHWFIEPESKLAESIYQNLQSLTGQDWDRSVQGFKRTGSSLHRFRCSRQSNGGFAAQSPVKLTRMAVTTSTLHHLGEINYDFMFQASILYAMMTAGEIHDGIPYHACYHFHISCQCCLRPIEEPILDTTSDYKHPDNASILSSWKPVNTPWSRTRLIPHIQQENWLSLTPNDQSYQIGRVEGFIYGDNLYTGRGRSAEGTLFPITISKYVTPISYLDGILDGLIRSASLNVIFRYSVHYLKNPKAAVIGSMLYLINHLSQDTALQAICTHNRFTNLLLSTPHKTPASYPPNITDSGLLIKEYMESRFLVNGTFLFSMDFLSRKVILFSDTMDLRTTGLMNLSTSSGQLLSWQYASKTAREMIKIWKEAVVLLRSDDPISEEVISNLYHEGLASVNLEVRYAAKTILPTPIKFLKDLSVPNWSPELICLTKRVEVDFISGKSIKRPTYPAPQIQDPLISGLRQVQLSTGSHYKVRAILHDLKLRVMDALCGGDGSGGIGSMVLRFYPGCRLLFNSLLDLSQVQLRGHNPGPPSAIELLGPSSIRCVNLTTAWEMDSDLSLDKTWDGFRSVASSKGLNINLMIFDMEVVNENMSDEIEKRVVERHGELLKQGGTIIYKTYYNRINNDCSILNKLGPLFNQVFCYTTGLSSSHTSEIYLVFTGKAKTSALHSTPDLEFLIKLQRILPVFQSPEDEFCRALDTKVYDFYQGVPRELIQSGEPLLRNWLISLGVETGLSYTLASQAFINDEFGMGEVVGLMIVGLNSLVPITTRYLESPISPSNNIVLKIGAFVTAVTIWISFVTEDFSIKQYSQDWINGVFPFSWEAISEKGYYRQTWSMSKSLLVRKDFYLNSKMASIGQLVRILARSCPKNQKWESLKSAKDFTNKFNVALTPKRFDRETGVIQAMLRGCYLGGLSYSSVEADVGADDYEQAYMD